MRRGHRRYPRMTALSLASACLAGILVPNGTFAGTRHAVTIDGMRYIPESIEVRPGVRLRIRPAGQLPEVRPDLARIGQRP